MAVKMLVVLRALLIMAVVAMQLHNSDGRYTMRIARRAAREGGGSKNHASPLVTRGAAPAQPCSLVLVDLIVPPPRVNCQPGVIKGVRSCSGACNSYVWYQNFFPYKMAQCSYCAATSYRALKKPVTVTFQCGSTNDTRLYNYAQVSECGCSLCRS